MTDSRTVTFGLNVTPKGVVRDAVKLARLAERLGFSYFMVGHRTTSLHPYVCLSRIAATTKKLRLGTGVTNPYLSHPLVIARALISLHTIAPERIFCGIGSGDRLRLESLGVCQPSIIQTLRESAQLIRAIFQGAGGDFRGKIFNLVMPEAENVPVKIPIYMGAQGIRMIELAAELADGVILNLSHPVDYRMSIDIVKKGLSRNRRRRNDFKTFACMPLHFDVDEHAVKKAVAPMVAAIAGGASQELLQRHSIPMERTMKMRRLIAKGRVDDAASLVTDELINAFSVSGTPESSFERIREVIRTGVDVVCPALHSVERRVVKRFAQEFL